MFNQNQISLDVWNELILKQNTIILKEIIIDRKSKYTVVWAVVYSKQDVDKFIEDLKLDKYFKNATHNSFAYRIKLENWSILEWKNDDGETWAWMCILREIQRVNWVNMILIVTRYFWWIKLQTDRFKNIIDWCKIFFEKIKNN